MMVRLIAFTVPSPQMYMPVVRSLPTGIHFASQP
jgi:hypothetical protein